MRTLPLGRALLVVAFILSLPLVVTASGGNAQENASALLGVTTDGPLGPFLMDAAGLPLYVRDVDSAAAVACDEACASIWPPYLVTSLPSAADQQVREDWIGLIRLDDGRLQVSYRGRPLHRHAREVDGRGPAAVDQHVRTLGQAISDEWGHWLLMTPQGEPLERLLPGL